MVRGSCSPQTLWLVSPVRLAPGIRRRPEPAWVAAGALAIVAPQDCPQYPA